MATINAANQSSTGIQSLTSAGAFNGRTITGTANQISVSNGDGTAGNPTLSLTSTIYVSGISFDSGSNTMSNYVQGTFTPTLNGTGSSPTVGYTTQLGRYTYIGNRLNYNIYVNPSSVSGGSGDVIIDGLPYTVNNTTSNSASANSYLSSITFGASVSYYQILCNTNTTNISIIGIVSAGSALTLALSGVPAGTSQIRMTGVYEV